MTIGKTRNVRRQLCRPCAVILLAAVFGGCAGSDGGSGDDSSSPPLVDVASLTTTTGTDGRVYLADGDGRALQMRGFNIKTRHPLDDASEQALDDGLARGFNLLRLSVYWHLLEPEQGQYDEAYLAQFETVLDRAGARGISVILSFHQDVFGPAFGDAGIPEWATRTDGLPFQPHDLWFLNYLEPAVQAAFEHLYEDQDLRDAQAAAWALVAARYGDHPAVIGYDLLNEPFGKLRPGESLAQAASRVQATQLTDMYRRLTAAIRAVDPDGWMFIEAPNVASIGLPVTLGAIDDPRVIFFPHFYDPNIETANYTGGDAEFDSSFFDIYEPIIRTYPEQHHVPMMIGEWGIAAPERPGMDRFVSESLALMDRVGSGWTMFTWCRGGGYCPIDAAGRDRPNIGQIVRPWARAIAGSPTSFTYDGTSRRLTIVFADGSARGSTDIFLASASTYPEGFEIVTSDDPGKVRIQIDQRFDIASVRTPRTGGAHAICLQPRGTAAPCTAE